MNPIIVWFRNDLRLADNPALTAAAQASAERGAPVIPLYILEEEAGDPWTLGGAQRWWLHGSLARLATCCARHGSPLVLRRAEPGAVLDALIAETGAECVLWNRRYTPAQIARDAAIKTQLKAHGIDTRSFNAGLLAEPLARLGAQVTGIDAAPENIGAARAHAAASGLDIEYIAGGIEDLSDRRFDLVTSMEVIEHVADPAAFVAGLAGALAPGGLMILSTPNRTPRPMPCIRIAQAEPAPAVWTAAWLRRGRSPRR